MAAKTSVMAEVGRRLRELREAREIPKEQVALALRMSAGNWAHYESGRNQLAVSQLPTLADLFGITVADLVMCLLDNGPQNDAHAVVTGEQERLPTHSDAYGNSVALYLDKPRSHGLRSGPARRRELVAAGAR